MCIRDRCWGAWSTLPTSILAPNTQCWTLVRIGKRENSKAPDHHLTTTSTQPVSFIVFHVPTFFYNHHKQRRKLCTLHNFRRWFMLFACPSQFSDPEGRWFESSRAHQNDWSILLLASFLLLYRRKTALLCLLFAGFFYYCHPGFRVVLAADLHLEDRQAP